MLAPLARKVLAIAASQALSERLFLGASVINAKMGTSLDADNVEALVNLMKSRTTVKVFKRSIAATPVPISIS